MTINEAMQALCDELTAGDVPAPLAQPFTLALVWYDLCRLAGETPPAVVAALTESPIPIRPLQDPPRSASRLAPRTDP